MLTGFSGKSPSCFRRQEVVSLMGRLVYSLNSRGDDQEPSLRMRATTVTLTASRRIHGHCACAKLSAAKSLRVSLREDEGIRGLSAFRPCIRYVPSGLNK